MSIAEERARDTHNEAKENTAPNRQGQGKLLVKPSNHGKTNRSRIPVPIAINKTRPSSSHQGKSNTVAMATNKPHPPPGRVTTTELHDVPSGVQRSNSSRVKRVPDFSKLHQQWAHRLERKKQDNRLHTCPTARGITTTTIRTSTAKPPPSLKHTPNAATVEDVKDTLKKVQFAVANEEETPTNNTSLARGTNGDNNITKDSQKEPSNNVKLESNFKVDPQSLADILSGCPARVQRGVAHRVTLAVGGAPREIPGELRIPHSLHRTSFYSRRPRQAHYSNRKDPSTTDCSTANLFTRLTQTTINSTRTLARVKGRSDDDITSFRGVKLNLEDQLSQVEGVTHPVSRDVGVAHIGGVLDHPSANNETLLSMPVRCVLPVGSQFYELERELCAVFRDPETVVQCIGGRENCNDPLATLLDRYYMVPITNETGYNSIMIQS